MLTLLLLGHRLAHRAERCESVDVEGGRATRDVSACRTSVTHQPTYTRNETVGDLIRRHSRVDSPHHLSSTSRRLSCPPFSSLGAWARIKISPSRSNELESGMYVLAESMLCECGGSGMGSNAKENDDAHARLPRLRNPHRPPADSPSSFSPRLNRAKPAELFLRGPPAPSPTPR